MVQERKSSTGPGQARADDAGLSPDLDPSPRTDALVLALAELMLGKKAEPRVSLV